MQTKNNFGRKNNGFLGGKCEKMKSKMGFYKIQSEKNCAYMYEVKMTSIVMKITSKICNMT